MSGLSNQLKQALAERKVLVGRLVRQYIPEDDVDNVKVASQFVLGNLEQHRFEDTNSHKVRKFYDGIQDALRLNALDSKADALEFLLEKFHAKKIDGDLKFDILSALYWMSDGPVRAQWHGLGPLAEAQKPENIEAEKRQLLRELRDCVEFDVDKWNDSSESDEEGSSGEEDETEPLEEPRPVAESAAERRVSTEDSSSRALRSFGKGIIEVMSSNENRKESDTEVFRDPCRLAEAYQNLQEKEQMVERVWPYITVSEKHLVRHVLFMLNCIDTELFFYDDRAETYIITKKVQCCSMSPESLDAILKRFIRYGNFRKQLEATATENRSASAEMTVDVFRSCLGRVLNGYREEIAVLEKESGDPFADGVTLLALEAKLNRQFQGLHYLVGLVKSAVLPQSEGAGEDAVSPARRACHLLSSVYFALDNQVMTTVDQRESIYESLLEILIQALTPYLRYLNLWVREGRVEEFTPEFFICRNRKIEFGTEEFWEKGYTMNVDDCPHFLVPFASQILLAGKSVNIIESVQTAAVRAQSKADMSAAVKTLGQEFEERARRIRDGPMLPAAVIVKTCLVDPLLEHVRRVNRVTVTILKESCKVVEHLGTMRNMYFMNAGDLMNQFALTIFSKIDRKEHWYRPHELKNALLEAQGNCDPIFSAESITLSVKDAEAHFRDLDSTVQVLNQLQMDYSVSWPLNILLNAETKAMYNEIFCFVMQITRAKYALESIRFVKDPRNRKEDLRSHFYLLLRSELLFFVNVMQHYIMTSVIHTTWKMRELSITEPDDVDSMRQAHHAFLAELLKQCLLDHKRVVIVDCVRKILNLALTFKTKYDLLTHNPEDLMESVRESLASDLRKLGVEFRACNRFLFTVLTKAVQGTLQTQYEDLLMRLNYNRFFDRDVSSPLGQS